MALIPSPNFVFLARHDPLLVQLPTLAEKNFADDPNTCLIKLRQFGERLAQQVAARGGLGTLTGESQLDLLDRLKSAGLVPQQTATLFHELRRHGNTANHRFVGDHERALHLLKMSHQLAVWFHRTFGDRAFKAGPFAPPKTPKGADEALKADLENLRRQLEAQRSAAEQARARAAEVESAAAQTRAEAEARAAEAQRLAAEAEARAAQAREEAALRAAAADARVTTLEGELATLQKLAEEAEATFAARLAALEAAAKATPPAERQAQVERAQEADAAIDLSEADTRRLIDAQLRDVGWEADTVHLSYRTGARPEVGKNRAIAEWPTATGPVDYALFLGRELVGVIEAKRKGKDVPAVLQQAKRYAEGLEADHGAQLHRRAPWGKYKVPFLFATNGRPYLEQLRTKSGIWHWDARVPGDPERPMAGWIGPEDLRLRIEQDPGGATERLAGDPIDILGLRPYQNDAILAVEAAIARGQRRILVAMATGTGKTRTAIGLMYRLLKARRFSRILFLVDRSALGEQTLEALRTAPVEQLQSFAKIYDVKGLDEIKPEAATRLQIATIQSMIKRILYAGTGPAELPTAGAYDCIIVDECHRGYTLDRELSERELLFRSEADYISKYRRVVEYFDAVTIGLTATPALHTAQIFGEPVARYTYRQAVVDGHLIDHEPPHNIITERSRDGIQLKAGQAVERYNVRTQAIDTVNLPDDVDFDVEDFHRGVITEPWNEVVCRYLAGQIDPAGPAKTLIFAVNSDHADIIVDKLKTAYRDRYGEIHPDAVVKITGDVDKPLQQIKKYKNEQYPTIAVTVDLLTTGIDVPTISNLVFMRRVRSRILYEQMLGRATRLCPDIEKQVFQIYDAVGLYKKMQEVSEMKPVAADPQITPEQLVQELRTVGDAELRTAIHEQLIARLRIRARRLKPTNARTFEGLASETPEAAVKRLQAAGPDGALAWIDAHADAFRVLVAPQSGDGGPLISREGDALVDVSRGYDEGQKPADFLESFGQFIRENLNKLPALAVVVQRPRELTRAQLREVMLALDAAGYNEAALRTAHRELTNQDIAASVIGFIRRQALGSPLVPYEERVDRAVRAILAQRAWTPPQRQWIDRIGKQLKRATVVDRDAFADEPFRGAGGFSRLDKVFDGHLDEVLRDLHDALSSALR